MADLCWRTWTIEGNTLVDLTTRSGRIVARLKQICSGAWELWDWRSGSLNERRIDVYLDLDRAKREGLATMNLGGNYA